MLAVLLVPFAGGWVGRGEFASMVIGGFVGLVELSGRYRHRPSRAVLTLPGITYVAVNMGASWAAFYMLDAFEIFKDRTLAKNLTQVLTAGFGSLVFLRSSLFKVRIGETDVGVGPAAVLDTLLLIVDRGVDRTEAVARAQEVSELVASVRNPTLVAKMLTRYCLALMQNVDENTARTVAEATDKIMADPAIPDEIRMDIVALRLGVIVGTDVLEAAANALGTRLNMVVSAGAPPIASANPASPTAADLKAEIDKGL